LSVLNFVIISSDLWYCLFAAFVEINKFDRQQQVIVIANTDDLLILIDMI